eukprot:INCI2054.1.p3 GENE.INCI2054.1~~INCI2054.1.p3  ORF type:complete len:134 (-),score=25.09 INCI2054.1:28-429(-)
MMERNLKYFLHRAKVLKQYRMFQRVLSKLRRSPEVGIAHEEIAAQVRAEYRQHSNETDMQRARFFLQEGERQLKTVLALVATTGPSGFDPYNMHQQPTATSKSTLVSRTSNDEATGFDTQSQGRLGVEWPWER